MIKYPEHEFIDKFDINGNVCGHVAWFLRKIYPEAEIWDIYSNPMGYAHTVCRIDGKFYDIVDKDGVADWHDLTYLDERSSPVYGRFHIQKRPLPIMSMYPPH